MSRPRGSNREYQAAVKTVSNMLELELWTNDKFQKALDTIESVMDDENAPATARRGSAEFIINLHNKLYRAHGGKAEYSDTGKQTQKKSDKQKEDEEDSGIISLKFAGNDD